MDLLQMIIDMPVEKLVIVLAIGGGCLVGLFGVLSWMITTTTDRKEFERSRREIAAFIAEGSISPEQGERLLAQKPTPSKSTV
jgi:hypothetical protein